MTPGYLITVGVIAVGMTVALVPLRRSGRLGILSWMLSMVIAESPFLALYLLLAITVQTEVENHPNTRDMFIALGLCGTGLAATIALSRRALRARAVVERALDDGLGPSWRSTVDSGESTTGHRLPWLHILLTPRPIRPRSVRRTANLAYGPHGRRNRLDVYRRRTAPTAAPILIHLHGGGFRIGRKNVTSRALLHRFAQRGWVCISANYRLRPHGSYPDFLIDVKRIIAWGREHAHEYGADSRCIIVAGSSAGAHLAVTSALTANDPRFQPGFTEVDTSVSAAVGLYGYYGPVEHGPVPSCPLDYIHTGAPPIMLAHGAQDTLATPVQARELAARLRARSTSPVVYAELPGAQHSFDMFWSIRFATVIDGIAAFATAVRANSARNTDHMTHLTAQSAPGHQPPPAGIDNPTGSRR